MRKRTCSNARTFAPCRYDIPSEMRGLYAAAAGGFAGSSCSFLLHPLDTVKTMSQADKSQSFIQLGNPVYTARPQLRICRTTILRIFLSDVHHEHADSERCATSTIWSVYHAPPHLGSETMRSEMFSCALAWLLQGYLAHKKTTTPLGPP